LQLVQEIIENEKARVELFKWKIILVAGLGAAASGLVGAKSIPPALPAALIPFVCVYVDLLAEDLALRIAVATRYLALTYTTRAEQPSDSQYAAFVEDADRKIKMASLRKTAGRVCIQLKRWDWPSSAYGVGWWAQYLSTFLLSLGVVGWGFVFLSHTYACCLSVVAGFGIGALLWSYLEQRRRFVAVSKIDRLPERSTPITDPLPQGKLESGIPS